MTFFARFEQRHRVVHRAQRLAPGVPGDDDVVAERSRRPVRRQDQHRRAGLEERAIEHAAPNDVMRQAFGPGRNHQVDAMGERPRPRPAFPPARRSRVGAASPASPRVNIRLTAASALRLGACARRADVDPDQSRLVSLSQRDGEASPLEPPRPSHRDRRGYPCTPFSPSLSAAGAHHNQPSFRSPRRHVAEARSYRSGRLQQCSMWTVPVDVPPRGWTESLAAVTYCNRPAFLISM